MDELKREIEILDARIVDVGSISSDWEVSLRFPNGQEVTVLIPTGEMLDDGPYGLNMVCRGHYT